MKNRMLPGVILKGAIMAALRTRGLSAVDVAQKLGIGTVRFRNVMSSSSTTAETQKVREKIIGIAGREMVEHIYTTLMMEEAEKLQKRAS